MLFLLLKNECDAIALGSNQVEVEVQGKNEFHHLLHQYIIYIDYTSKMVGENCSILPVLDDAAKLTIFLKLLSDVNSLLPDEV